MSLTPKDVSVITDLEDKDMSIIDNLDLLLPEEMELSGLAGLCSKSRDTIRKHLRAKYVENKDYHQKTKGGKIYVDRDVALEIRGHYVK